MYECKQVADIYQLLQSEAINLRSQAANIR